MHFLPPSPKFRKDWRHFVRMAALAAFALSLFGAAGYVVGVLIDSHAEAGHA